MSFELTWPRMGANPSRACCCSFTRGWGSCFSEKCRM